MESVDWRTTELSPNARQKIINKIIDNLKKYNPFLGPEKLHQLKSMAIMFEEKIYTRAESKFGYLRNIGIKMEEISKQSKATRNPVNPSDPGVGSQGVQQANNQGQPPHVTGLFNHPQASKQILPQSIHMNSASSSALQPSRGMSQSTVTNSSQNSSLQNIQNMSTMPNMASQNSSVQNMSGVQHISVGNSMGQSIQIPSASNVSQRQIPGSQQQPQNAQHYRYQQQLHQISNQQFQQNNNTTSVQSHIQQKLMQPTYFQQSQQSNMRPTMLQSSSVSNAQQNQQPVYIQSGQPVIQHHQQSVISQERQQQQQPPLRGQQNNLSNIQQNSIGQCNNFSAIHQQHSGPQSSQKRQQHQLLGTQSGNSTMMNNQHSALLVQSTQGQRSQVELQQQAMPQIPIQSGKLYHQSNIKPEANMSHGDMQRRLPTSQAFQQQIQKQLFQQHRAMPETSSISVDPISSTGDLNSGDWQEEAYQKIKTVKDKYMRWLVEMHRKTSGALYEVSLVEHDSDPQQPKSKKFADLAKYKQTLEACVNFLQLPKTNIPPNYKENLGNIERNVAAMVSRLNRKPGAPQQQPVTAPHINSPHQSQQTQVQPHENQVSSQMQSVSSLQHNNMGSLQPTSTMLQPHQLKQLQDREMQRQQLLHEQLLLNQQHQLHPRTKQQQPNRNQINNGKELEVRQQTGNKSEPLKQQKLSVYQQQLKSGTPFSSAQLDKRHVLNSETKSGTPLQYANSPLMVSSPSTPYTSHLPIDSEKVSYGISTLSNAGNVGHQSTAATLPSQPLANATTGISASPLLSEFTSPDGNHGYGASVVNGMSSVVPTEEGLLSPVSHPHTPMRHNQDRQGASCLASIIEDPMEHLLRVVKSMSPISLTSAVSDISSAFSTFDSISQSEPGDGSIAEVGEDLAAMTKSHLQRPFVSEDEFTDTRKAKRLGHTICLDASEWESTVTSIIKRPRIERRHPLFDEIREINQGLIDTVVDISQEEVDPTAALGVGKGTVIKCSFSAVALDPNLKSHYASESSPIQPLRLLVPANYPNCSPLLLDEFPDEVSKECDDLSIKAKCRFSSCVGRFTHPVSLSEMARAWDVCARTVILEYAQQNGGGTFTSKYGAWKDYLATA